MKGRTSYEPANLKKSGPRLLRGPILYGAVYIRPLPSQFILPRPSPLSNEGSIQIRGPVPKLQLKHLRCPDLPTSWREVVLADVRFVSHDLPLKFHPAAIRVSANVTPFGAG
jgi:hypothetical protein